MPGTDGRRFIAEAGSPSLRLDAVNAILRTHLSLWFETASNAEGVMIGDPKPANSVIQAAGGKLTARIIDLDRVKPGPLEELITKLELYGYNSEVIGSVLREFK